MISNFAAYIMTKASETGHFFEKETHSQTMDRSNHVIAPFSLIYHLSL